MIAEKMKILVVACACILLVAGSALADDTVGYVDPQRVLLAHPKYDSAQKNLEKFAQAKAEATKKAIDKEKNPQKKAEIYETAKRESGQQEQVTMSPIMKDINAAISKAAKQRSITVVLNKSLVFLGGVDLTDEVVKLLKK